MDTQQAPVTPRGGWVAALTALPPPTVIALSAEIARAWQVEPLTIPQAGLLLLRMRESVYGEEFYGGELPFARASVELVSPGGQRYPGAAQVMGDSAELALALAICDAVLAHALDGHKRVAAAVEQGAQQRAVERRRRELMLIKTRVDFSPLDARDAER